MFRRRVIANFNKGFSFGFQGWNFTPSFDEFLNDYSQVLVYFWVEFPFPDRYYTGPSIFYLWLATTYIFGSTKTRAINLFITVLRAHFRVVFKRFIDITGDLFRFNGFILRFHRNSIILLSSERTVFTVKVNFDLF